MQRKRLADMECSIARTLDVVGDWWTLMIVRDLFAFMTMVIILFFRPSGLMGRRLADRV